MSLALGAFGWAFLWMGQPMHAHPHDVIKEENKPEMPQVTFWVIKKSQVQCPNKVGLPNTNTTSFPFTTNGEKPAVFLEKDHSNPVRRV